MKKPILICYLFLLFATSYVAAQSINEKMIKVQVVPVSTDTSWLSNIGDKALFQVKVLKNNISLPTIDIQYQLSEDNAKPGKMESVKLTNGELVIDGGTLHKPGFLRCKVTATYQNQTYEGMATIGYEPHKIAAKTKLPDDFMEFWNNAKQEADRLPMDIHKELLPDKCNDKVNVYSISFQNYRQDSRIYGILTVPNGGDTYPAVLSLPGAGVRKYEGNTYNATKYNVITLEIGVHGIPIDQDDKIYKALSAGPLYKCQIIGLENRDRYYYKRVYLGCVRAIDFLASLPEFDGRNMIVQGGSQGGALSIVTAALNPKVTALVSFFPALCNMTGGGWPHFDFTEVSDDYKNTSYYYDVVNFASMLRVPGYYSFGYNDVTCVPSSVYSAMNKISAPKEYFIIAEAGHRSFWEQNIRCWQWINNHIRKEK